MVWSDRARWKTGLGRKGEGGGMGSSRCRGARSRRGGSVLRPLYIPKAVLVIPGGSVSPQPRGRPRQEGVPRSILETGSGSVPGQEPWPALKEGPGKGPRFGGVGAPKDRKGP